METLPTAPPGRRGRWTQALVLAVALVPSLPWWLHMSEFGRLPSNDYYAVLMQVARPDGSWETGAGAWLRMRSNEHHVTIPAAIYAANVVLFHGDNRGLVVWCLLVLSATVAVLLALLPAEVGPPPWRALTGLLLGVLVFNPVQSHNVIMAFSGVMWLTSNLLAALAIAGLVAHVRTGRWRWLAGGLVAGLLGAVTYSSNLALWPALVVGALILRVRWRSLATVAAAATAALAFYGLTYHRPAIHPELETEHGGTLVAFVSRYLGSLFAGEPGPGVAFGALLLAASVVFWTAVALRHRGLGARLAPWAMLQLYAVGNAVGTAVGRSGMGPDAAIASRYANLAALAWIGLLAALAAALAGAVRTSREQRPIALLAGLLAVAFLAVGTWARGGPTWESFLRRAERQGEAEVALNLGIELPATLSSVTPAPHQLWSRLAFLKRVGHVPFDRPLPFVVGERIDDTRVVTAAESPVAGKLERAHRAAPGVAEVNGWATSRAGEIAWIVLVDQNWVVRGGGGTGFARRPPEGGRSETNGWRGWMRIDPRISHAKAYALLEGDDRLHGIPPRTPIGGR